MYVCICAAITEEDIREAVRGGTCSMRELSHDLGVATGCGQCARQAHEILDVEMRRCSEAVPEETNAPEAAPGEQAFA